MKLLLIVPGFTPPWTEGRRNFVRDLIPVLQEQVELQILGTGRGPFSRKPSFSVPVTYALMKTKALELISLYQSLKRQLASVDRPGVVIHFPYGTFSGMRGFMNKLSIIKIHRLVTKAGLPCLTVLYSMTRGDLSRLCAQIPTLATAEGRNWTGPVVNVGLDIQHIDPIPCPKNNKRLIFMAGYHENKSSLLKKILYERGLIDIIHIGEQLACRGFQLSIAIPLLRHPERRAELQRLLRKVSPSLPVTLFTEVDIYGLFAQHSLYIFPQRENYSVFIPTSVLEAMAIGIPVIIPDLPMLVSLTGKNNDFCLSYRAREPESLFQAVLHASQHWDETCKRAIQAQLHIRENWTIEHSVRQIMDIVMALTG